MICIKVVCFSMKVEKLISFLLLLVYLSFSLALFKGNRRGKRKILSCLLNLKKKKNPQENLNEEKNVF